MYINDPLTANRGQTVSKLENKQITKESAEIVQRIE